MIKLLNLNYWIKQSILTGLLLTLISCGLSTSEQKTLQNAKIYIDKDELRAAAIELRNTLQKNNENAEARYLLGSISLELGDLASAEKEFKRAALAGWSQEETQVALARIFIGRGKFQNLLDEIIVIDTWPIETKANILALRALANASLKQIAQAKTTLDKARSHRADALHVLKVTTIFQLSDIQDGDAAVTLKEALSIYPENTELLLLYASYSEKNRDLIQASNTLKKVISLDPTNLTTANGRKAHISLARIFIIEKKYDEATTTLTRVLKRNNKDLEANYLRGLLAFIQRDYHLAEQHVRKLLAIIPDHIQSQQLMGRIKYALKDYDQAAHHLSVYLLTNPDDTTTRKLLTNTYINLNQSEQARSTLQAALTVNPDDIETLTLQSQIEFNDGDINASIQTLNKAIKFSPDNIAPHKQLAKAYIAIGETEQALNEIKTFQELSKDTEETHRLTISAYLKAGEINKAINYANEMLKNNPQDPDIIAIIGTLHAANDDTQQARTYFNKALQLKDKLPAAVIGLARLESKDGNFDKAIALYSSLVETKTGGITPMLALSEIAAQQDRISDMLSWLERARDTAPTETKPRLILANYYLRNDQPEKANNYIQEAITVSPGKTEVLALHGKILIAQKRYSEALPQLKKLVYKLPDSVEARILISETFLRQGMIKDAREHLKIILSKQNNHILALGLLAEIELKEANYDGSFKYAKQLQKAQPQLYLGYLQEGNIWMAKHDYNSALSAYSLAWKYQQTADLAKKLFTASKHSADLEADIKPLLVWLEAHPNDNSTRFFLATTYQNKGENDKAIQQYEITIKQAPDNAVVLNNLAWLYSLKGSPRALDFAEHAYRLMQTNPGILDTYGWILVQQGQALKGLHLLEQSLEQIPGNLEIRYHHAVALIKSGNTSEGRRSLEKLLAEDKPFSGMGEAEQLLETQEASR